MNGILPQPPLRLNYTFLGSRTFYPTHSEFELNYTSVLQALSE